MKATLNYIRLKTGRFIFRLHLFFTINMVECIFFFFLPFYSRDGDSPTYRIHHCGNVISFFGHRYYTYGHLGMFFFLSPFPSLRWRFPYASNHHCENVTSFFYHRQYIYRHCQAYFFSPFFIIRQSIPSPY